MSNLQKIKKHVYALDGHFRGLTEAIRIVGGLVEIQKNKANFDNISMVEIISYRALDDIVHFHKLVKNDLYHITCRVNSLSLKEKNRAKEEQENYEWVIK